MQLKYTERKITDWFSGRKWPSGNWCPFKLRVLGFSSLRGQLNFDSIFRTFRSDYLYISICVLERLSLQKPIWTKWETKKLGGIKWLWNRNHIKVCWELFVSLDVHGGYFIHFPVLEKVETLSNYSLSNRIHTSILENNSNQSTNKLINYW